MVPDFEIRDYVGPRKKKLVVLDLCVICHGLCVICVKQSQCGNLSVATLGLVSLGVPFSQPAWPLLSVSPSLGVALLSAWPLLLIV